MKVYLNKFDLKLSDAQLQDLESGKSVTSWVQIFRPGTWDHPRYGKLKFTNEIFDGFVKNFKERVRKIDLAIDQEHQPEKGACAWIRDVENRGSQTPEQGLWALVEWTKWGLQLVADGVFKYLSGDFDYEWKDEETGKKYENVLFGAALTNRPFIKGMSPINLSEFRGEFGKDDIQKDSDLEKDILKLKEENKVAKTDAEIMGCKDEELTPEEMARKQELMKKNEEEMLLAKKKECAERAKKVGLAEDATLEEIEAKEKTLAEVITPANTQLVKLAGILGLGPDATVDQIEAAATKLVQENKNAIVQNTKLAEENEFFKKKEEEKTAAPSIAERAKAVGLPETATEEEVIAKEKEQQDAEAAKSLSDIPAMEKRLSEMKEKKADAFTIKLLEENIASKKKLAEEVVRNAKEKIEMKLKEHFRSGKLIAKERDVLKAILFSEVESGETSYQLSEKDKDGKNVEAVKTLAEIIDGILSDRPAIVELKSLAAKELSEPPKENSKELSEEEARDVAARVAGKITKSTKSAKKE